MPSDSVGEESRIFSALRLMNEDGRGEWFKIGDLKHRDELGFHWLVGRTSLNHH
ncbi:hypothetical protein NLM16_05970 [Bradyrhizobium brasilense]|uniref:hypothetical protein n=1 Tax=Bradyrhizobium brasilense TaxID=1419277 RepID=UPI002877A76B|nr:hypothetical protein [Bradyrhizobium brasilense]MCP3413641.1 hypothetical protein [Bradyrhizobium brasilense]